jgi:arylsulfatase A-like enzyme
MTGKGMLLEEATRVPLIVKVPGDGAGPPKSTTVTTPVSQLDLFSTIMDYLHAPASLDTSDGTSLRRFIDRTSYNQWYDEGVVVAENDGRVPKSPKALSGDLGAAPTLMVRHGSYKLILPRSAKSKVIDMMYNLDSDPYVPCRRRCRMSVRGAPSLTHTRFVCFSRPAATR